MSKVIKASQIKGKYKLPTEGKKVKKHKTKASQKKETQEQSIDLTQQKESILDDAKAEADEIIAAAKAEADKILTEAKKEEEKIEQLKQQGYEEGYQEGKTAGLHKTQTEINAVVETINEKVEQLNQQYQQQLDAIQPRLIQLSLTIASKIVNTKIDETPEMINNIIKDILGDLSNNHQNFVVNVNPEVLPYINRTELMRSYENNSFTFNADNSLKRTDCIISTNFGGKDAFLNKKLELLEENLLNELGYSDQNVG